MLEGKKEYVTTVLANHIFIKAEYYGHYGNPNVTSYQNEEQAKRDIDLLYRLQREGYVTIKEITLLLGANGCDGCQYFCDASMTQKMTKYSDYNDPNLLKVRVADVAVDRITGITKHPIDHNSRVVEYISLIVPNELGKFINLSADEMKPIKKEAIFTKYDDGWRLID